MATKLPYTLLPGQVDRVLYFLNSAMNIEDITENEALKDDPFYDEMSGYTIGEKVAKKLLKAKKKLPRGRFRTIEQVLAVKGMGADKLNDIKTSFWRPAADTFKRRLFDDQILRDNWTVDFWTIDFEDDIEGFQTLVNEEHLLRQLVQQKVEDIVQEKHETYPLANLASELLHYLPMQGSEARLISSHEFALWWYRFDQDNWFSFETILRETTDYFNHYSRYDLELVMFRGFVNGGTLSEAITVKDLPVILNHGERRVTIWAASLYD